MVCMSERETVTPRTVERAPTQRRLRQKCNCKGEMRNLVLPMVLVSRVGDSLRLHPPCQRIADLHAREDTSAARQSLRGTAGGGWLKGSGFDSRIRSLPCP